MTTRAHTVFAFDVDHTLEVSDGPVTVAALRELVEQGQVVGLCGNWAAFVRAVPDWQRVISFLGPLGITKAEFLSQLRLHVPARDYVMVGNDPGTGIARRLRAPARQVRAFGEAFARTEAERT